jgi:hypothetical protein
MARYDDKINQLLGEYILAERNRNRRNKKDSMNLGKGAEEQKFDKDIAQDQEDEDAEETANQKTYGGNKGDKPRRFNKKTGRKSAVKDYDEEEGLKENIEGIGLGGMMNMSGSRDAAPGWKYADQEDEDKTGEVSDRDLVRNVKKKHTAGQKLLTKAARELKKNRGSLSSSTRDALARDEYASWSGHGREEDAESWVDPAHEGDCTPMSKPSCTPRRKAFARRAKAGDFKKK